MANIFPDLPEMDRLLTTHGDLFVKHFSEDLDEQTAVLKAHLLIEGLLRDFICNSVRHPEHLRGLKLTFPQVVGVTKSIMILAGSSLDLYWGMIVQLNKLRNLMAHELEPDQAKFDRCRKALISLSGSTTLNQSLSYLCGAMTALLATSLEFQKHKAVHSSKREDSGNLAS